LKHNNNNRNHNKTAWLLELGTTKAPASMSVIFSGDCSQSFSEMSVREEEEQVLSQT
jgi:hypothetical protein